MVNNLTCLCVDDKFYLVKRFISSKGNPNQQDSIIEYYDPGKNEWHEPEHSSTFEMEQRCTECRLQQNYFCLFNESV